MNTPTDPTITDKAVTAAARTIFDRMFSDVDWDRVPQSHDKFVAHARAVLEAALPHLADQPATTGDGRAEALSSLLRRSVRKTAVWRRHADTVAQSNKESASAARRMLDERQQEIEQLRARLLHLSEEHAARQSADRDTETAAPAWQVGDKAMWRGREVKVLAVNQVVIEHLGMALTRDANELEQHPDDAPLRGGK